MASSSSWSREPKLSTYGFCHGEPGSTYPLPTFEKRPVPERVRGHLRPMSQRMNARTVPRSATGGRAPSRCGSNAPPALDRQRHAGELVHDVQQLQQPAGGGLIELEVDRPYGSGR
jgi:hypothetical protein